MSNLSKYAQEIIWGDAALLAQLKEYEKKYLEGHRIAIWHALEICGHVQFVIPDWVRDGVEEISDGLNSGELKSFNEAFGVKLASVATRKKQHRIAKNKSRVLSKLFHYRLADGSLNAEQAFEPIAEELGISRRDVEEVYKKHGKFIKTLPRTNPENVLHTYCESSSSMPKRHGRAITKDADTCDHCGASGNMPPRMKDVT